jgi:hypothetical protein
MTMLISVIMIYPLTWILGSIKLAYFLCLTTAVFAAINTMLGAEIDHLCTRALYSVFPDFEEKANKLVLQQVGASTVHAVAVSIILVIGGGLV